MTRPPRALGLVSWLALACAGSACRVEQDLGENLEGGAVPDASVAVDAIAVDAATQGATPPDAMSPALPPDAGALDDGGLGCDGGRLPCNGECVDPQSNIKNCGTCNVRCTVGMEICLFAKCSPCFAGSNCNNTCTKISTDHDNCGSCGHACAMNQTCSNGLCRP